jgi:hypothetical protein
VGFKAIDKVGAADALNSPMLPGFSVPLFKLTA